VRFIEAFSSLYAGIGPDPTLARQRHLQAVALWLTILERAM
jgi:hypothetical protein